MSNSPPTLLDRLTRFSPPEREPQKESRRRRLREEAPPVLSDRINYTPGDGVHTRFMTGDEAESYRSTEFAMTSMNVPDRLDQREVRYRAEEEYKRPGLLSFDRYLLGLWTRRIILLTLLGLLVIWGVGKYGVIRDALSPSSIASRLSGSGVLVQIADVSYRLTPRPQIVLEGVEVGGEFRADQVALELNWRDLWSSAIGQSANWGIATVSGLRVSGQEAWGLLLKVVSIGSALPQEVSAVRFESVTVADEPLVGGEYALLLQRNRSGVFEALQITPKGKDPAFKLSLKPAPLPALEASALEGAAPAEAGPTPPRFAFTFAANDWTLPVGPGGQWTEVVAEGYLSPKLLEIESYALSGRYGVVRGALYAATDLYWVLTGYAHGTGIDIESIVLATAAEGADKPAFSEKERKPIPFSGIGKFQLTAEGHGKSLDEVLRQSVASGPMQVRWAMIRGVNLGYIATHGGGIRGLGGGLTRFSDFDAVLLVRPGGLLLSNIVASAGALAARGYVKMDRQDNALSGSLSVGLGTTRVQAPVALKVGGQPLTPEFGR